MQVSSSIHAVATTGANNQVQRATVYARSNGQIIGSLMHNAFANCISDTTDQVMGNFDANAYYVDITQNSPIALPRPVMGITLDKTAITANNTDTATFSGVPSGVQAVIDTDAPETITDGTLELTATVAGTYTVSFSLFPYVPMTFEVVAS